MAIGKPLKILYFLNGAAPSKQDLVDAETYGYGTVFRNKHHVPMTGALEDCDAVAGNVPPRYQKKFPIATRVMQAVAPETPSAVAPMAADGDAPAPGSVQSGVGAAPQEPAPAPAGPVFSGTPAPAPAVPGPNLPGWKPGQ